jgi:hypothetical protein
MTVYVPLCCVAVNLAVEWFSVERVLSDVQRIRSFGIISESEDAKIEKQKQGNEQDQEECKLYISSVFADQISGLFRCRINTDKTLRHLVKVPEVRISPSQGLHRHSSANQTMDIHVCLT